MKSVMDEKEITIEAYKELVNKMKQMGLVEDKGTLLGVRLAMKSVLYDKYRIAESDINI